MLDNIINKNIVFLQNHGVKIDNDDDKAIYRYGLHILYYYIIDLVVIFSLAYIFDRLYETVIMTFIFGLLQVFGGGYHAKTPLKCLSLMVIGTMAGNILISIFFNYNFFMIISASIMVVIIFVVGPIKNKNHPVNKKIYRRSKFIEKAIISITILLMMFLSIFNKYIEVAALTSTLCLYFVSLISAKIKEIKTGDKNVFK